MLSSGAFVLAKKLSTLHFTLLVTFLFFREEFYLQKQPLKSILKNESS